MITNQIASLLAELDVLELAQAAIDARKDLTEAFTWQCVAEAIRDRRKRLLDRAEFLLREIAGSCDAQAPALTADVPGRVH